MTECAITVGSLFSGIGGIDLGLERVGMTVAWQCEKDEAARRVLARHWPSVPCYDDVTTLKGPDVPRVDVLCGGFPCQDLSVAGRRAGLAGERSGLFHEFMRLAAELAPRWLLIENVLGLLSSNEGADMGVVLDTLAAARKAARATRSRSNWTSLNRAGVVDDGMAVTPRLWWQISPPCLGVGSVRNSQRAPSRHRTQWFRRSLEVGRER